MAAVIVATIFLLIFRTEIANFINRAHKVETPLGNVSSPEQRTTDVASQTLGTPHEAPKAETAKSSTGGPLTSLPRAVDITDRVDPMFRKFHETRIMADSTYANEPDHAKREAMLVRHLAAMTMLWDFEIIYRIIFGSQITALKFLSTQREPIHIVSLRSFYDPAKEANAEIYREYEFERWFAFIEARGLVFVDGDKVSIDMKGIAFLKFITEFRYNEQRSL